MVPLSNSTFYNGIQVRGVPPSRSSPRGIPPPPPVPMLNAQNLQSEKVSEVPLDKTESEHDKSGDEVVVEESKKEGFSFF